MAQELEGSEKLSGGAVLSLASERAMPPPRASEGIAPPPAQGSTAEVLPVDVDEKAELFEVVEKSLRAPRPEPSQSKPLNHWEKRAGIHDQPTTWTRH